MERTGSRAFEAQCTKEWWIRSSSGYVTFSEFQFSFPFKNPAYIYKPKVFGTDWHFEPLVMRADGVLRLLLNSKLYKGLNPTVEGKTVLMTLPNVGEKEMAIICLRVSSLFSTPYSLERLWQLKAQNLQTQMSNVKVAEELADFIHEHIPLDSANTSKSPQPQVW